MTYFEVSAQSGANIDDAFVSLSRSLISALSKQEPKVEALNLKMKSNKLKKLRPTHQNNLLVPRQELQLWWLEMPEWVNLLFYNKTVMVLTKKLIDQL